jgi:hypothetical protein
LAAPGLAAPGPYGGAHGGRQSEREPGGARGRRVGFRGEGTRRRITRQMLSGADWILLALSVL